MRIFGRVPVPRKFDQLINVKSAANNCTTGLARESDTTVPEYHKITPARGGGYFPSIASPFLSAQSDNVVSVSIAQIGRRSFPAVSKSTAACPVAPSRPVCRPFRSWHRPDVHGGCRPRASADCHPIGSKGRPIGPMRPPRRRGDAQRVFAPQMAWYSRITSCARPSWRMAASPSAVIPKATAASSALNPP